MTTDSNWTQIGYTNTTDTVKVFALEARGAGCFVRFSTYTSVGAAETVEFVSGIRIEKFGSICILARS